MSTVPCHFTYTFPLLGSGGGGDPSTDPPDPLTYTHPIPPSLLSPPPPGHRTYHSHLLDILTTINHLHHSDCLAAISLHTPVCSAPGCTDPVTDALKAPTPLLVGVSETMVSTACVGVCGAEACAGVVRGMMTKKPPPQQNGNDDDDGGGWGREEGDGCAQCGRQQYGGMRKCKGCGVVRYCGERCQRKGWKAGHRWVCKRGVEDGAAAGGAGQGREGKGGLGEGTAVGGEGKGDLVPEAKAGGEEGEKGGKEIVEEVPDPEDEIWEE